MARRPTIGIGGTPAHDAERAVALLREDLQFGWDHHDADITDRRLGDDVMWGSPFGAALRGYDRLHGIHEELKQKSVGGDASHFEVVEWLTPAPGVAVAQIRRAALDERGAPLPASRDTDGAFSEMALYVLVERDGDWWVAAGQNTLISR
jgi:hypothetical protein